MSDRIKYWIARVRSKEKETVLFIFIFYAVGITGMLLPLSFHFFIQLIPVALLLSFFILTIFHESPIGKKSLFVYCTIFLLGIIIEIIGVKTGVIFGEYNYGDSLGFKIYNTPIVIGLNWLLLVYTTSSVLEKLKLVLLLKILLSSLMMIIYDIILEQVAPKLDMWHWKNDSVPFRNYIAWFIISILFHFLIKATGVKTQNKLAMAIFTSQILFFMSLLVFLK